MTRCESYPPCFGTIYFPTAPFLRLDTMYLAVLYIYIYSAVHLDSASLHLSRALFYEFALLIANRRLLDNCSNTS